MGFVIASRLADGTFHGSLGLPPWGHTLRFDIVVGVHVAEIHTLERVPRVMDHAAACQVKIEVRLPRYCLRVELDESDLLPWHALGFP